MRISIVGTGYVGLVTGTCFAEMGVNVTCVDINTKKIEGLKKGIIPIYEPGLDTLISHNVNADRLHFTTRIDDVINNVQILFCAVGTPSDEDGSADMKYVIDVAKRVGQLMNDYILFVTKSTVPVGTAKLVRETIENELKLRNLTINFDIASNPEFLKEGDAIKDFMSPDRVVVGVESDKAKDLMSKLYRPFLLNNFRVIFMDIISAELTKYAANAMLATRISFINEIANLCEIVGADVNNVRKGIGADQRIGNKFLYAGCGYGGSCFPKDVRALLKISENEGYTLRILRAVDDVNELQKGILIKKIEKNIGKDFTNKTIAVWGLSFKPNTNDMREAPSLTLIKELILRGASVRVFDPVAIDEAMRIFKHEEGFFPLERVYFATDIYDSVIDTDALVLVTEWKEFRMPAWEVIRKLVKNPLIIDGRNIYVRSELENLNYKYESIGS